MFDTQQNLKPSRDHKEIVPRIIQGQQIEAPFHLLLTPKQPPVPELSVPFRRTRIAGFAERLARKFA